MQDFSLFYAPNSNDKLLSDSELMFEYQLESVEGSDVLINGSLDRVILRNSLSPLNELKEEREVFCRMSSDIKRGSIVNFEDENYLVNSDVDKHFVYKKAKMMKCNHILKWIDSNGELKQSPSIVANATLYTTGTTEDKYIIEGNAKESITLPNNDITKSIERDKRFIINGNYWKVTNINRDMLGIINIMCEESKYNPATDNPELEIADYSNLHTYELKLLNQSPLLCTIGVPQSIEVQAFDNGVIVENPETTYEVSDNTIAEIVDNQLIGLVEGICNLTIKYQDQIITTEINVSANVTTNYTLEIQGNNSINWGYQSQYNTISKNNGVTYDSITTFNLTDVSNNATNLAQIISATDNTCIIKANDIQYSGYVILHCTNNEGITETKQIRIKSLWVS